MANKRQMFVATGMGGGGGLQYWQRIKNLFGSSLIGYWLLDEASGTTAKDSSGNSRNGTYTGVTLANTANPAPIGGLAPSFTTGSVVNVYGAGLASAFNGLKCTVIAWVKVSGASIWTDGTVRNAAIFMADTNNRVYLRRSTTNNMFEFGYIAGGVNKSTSIIVTTTTDWTQIAMTIDHDADQLIRYQNGVQLSSVITGLGSWSGVGLAADNTCIGAGIASTKNLPWSGWLSNVILLDRAATAAEVRAAYPFDSSALVFDGDSRTAKAWPTDALINSGKYQSLSLSNMAVAGQSVATMITNAPAGVDAKIYGSRPTCFIWGGINDGADAATLYSRLQTYCQGRRAAGWRVIVCSEIDAQGATQLANGWHSTVYLALNTALRNDHSWADGFVDLGADARLQNALDTTYYLTDKIHLTDAGYAVVSGLVAQALAAV